MNVVYAWPETVGSSQPHSLPLVRPKGPTMPAPTEDHLADDAQLVFRSRVVQILAIETAVLYAFLALFVDIHPFWVRLVLGFLGLSAAVVALAVRGRTIATHTPGRALIVSAMLCVSFVAFAIFNPGLPALVVFSIFALT